MDHDQIRERLFEYRDGELGRAERAEIEAHLTGCRECTLALVRWGKLSMGAFAATAEVKPSEAFVSRVMAGVADLQPPIEAIWDWRFRWLTPAFALAAAAFLWFSTPSLLRDVSAEALLLAEETDASGGPISRWGQDAERQDLIASALEAR